MKPCMAHSTFLSTLSWILDELCSPSQGVTQAILVWVFSLIGVFTWCDALRSITVLSMFFTHLAHGIYPSGPSIYGVNITFTSGIFACCEDQLASFIVFFSLCQHGSLPTGVSNVPALLAA